MNFDIQSYGLFVAIILLTLILEQDNKLDKYLPKNKWFFIILFGLLGGLYGWNITHYNFNLTECQTLLIGLVIYRVMSILINKSKR